MSQGWVVTLISLGYLIVLFGIAWYGDKKRQWLARWRPWIYSLSIAVYCTSWTFYGTVGQASDDTWSFVPIYLAPILVFVFAWRVLARIILIAKREHITSIADFIAARYGKSQALAVAVTLIALLGILPYIALQLRGIALGVEQIAPQLSQTLVQKWGRVDFMFMLTLLLALFTIVFGSRHIDTTEHHRGLMLAVAFESLLKLVAFLLLAGFAVFWLIQPPVSSTIFSMSSFSWQAPNWPTFAIHTLLAMTAIICLPRQFHTIVVENQQPKDLHLARKVFPLYLLLMGLGVLPIAILGQQLLPTVSADTLVINLPLYLQHNWLAILTFLGGTSAAAGMVIVSTIALAIMLSNDLVLPLLLRRLPIPQRSFKAFSQVLLKIRRLLIGLVLLAAWGVALALESISSLATIGLLAFAAMAQFAPALIGGIYWRKGNRNGVFCGLAVGITLWLLTLMQQADLLAGSGETNVVLWLLTPPSTLLAAEVSITDWGMFLSLLANLLCYVVVSLLSRASLTERLQAASFVGVPVPEQDSGRLYQTRVTVAELEMLVARFVGRKRTRQAFAQYSQQHQPLVSSQLASANLIRHTERMLAGVFGTSTARLVLSSALEGRNMQLEEVATIVDEASELFDFSRGLLQGAIEHISQGIAVVDKKLYLVAWNQRYLELFHFPAGLIQVGRPIEDVIRHNAQMGLCGPGDPEWHVAKRVEHLKRGTAHTSSRIRPDGQVIEVQGNPMPGGGFVMSFTDITAFRQAEAALQEANENLEARVQQRTQQLEQLNRRLVVATQQAERQAHSKSRFLAAVSHDLMQPLNAAKLFSSSLAEVAQEPESQQLARHIESSLEAAEDLISDLLDISRLEAGKLNTQVHAFALSDVLNTLNVEFSALAQQQGTQFSLINTQAVIYSDPKLLRRALQNFLTNALRYNPGGKVLLGVRRKRDDLLIEVWDNGPGIEASKQAQIFDEFTRFDQDIKGQGLGLGLAIAKGIARVLNHPLDLRSWPGKGTVFSLQVSRATVAQAKPITRTTSQEMSHSLQGLRVLCVDNEAPILAAMKGVLSRWQCDVRLAPDLFSALQHITPQWQPQVILTDFHLDRGQTGLEVLQQCRLRLGQEFAGVVISADRTTAIQERVKTQGFAYLSKPVKPLKLRALLNQITQQQKKQRLSEPV
ncbi:TPA: PAS domain-containing hybrid sensor histidine kinase/response regulator [Photobacterium damselae]